MRFWLLLALAFVLAQAAEWRERKNEAGVIVSTRESNESRIDEFRAVGIVAAPVERIALLIEDVARSPEWVKYCQKGRFIKRLDENRTLTYTINNLPWPLTGRDSAVLNVRAPLENGAIRIDFTAAPEAVGENPELVRIKLLKGFWLIEPVENGSQVTYQVLSDPGRLPAWMVNMGIVDQPFETLRALQKRFNR